MTSTLRFVGLAAALAFAAFPRCAAAAPSATRGTVTQLSNGLRVVISPDDEAASVAVEVRYGVGSQDDPAGRSGLANLTGHMAIDVTRHVPHGAAARLLEAGGGTPTQIRVSHDETRFAEEVPPEQVALALWLESDRMASALDGIDPDAFEGERVSVMNALARRHDLPLGHVDALRYEAIFPPTHPYHQPADGVPGEMARIRLGEARAFAQAWYTPANATLVVAGKVDAARVMPLVTKYFGPVAHGNVPVRPPPPAVSEPNERTVEIGANADRPRVYVSWITPALGDPADLALDLLGSALQKDRLTRALVDAGVARTVRVYEDSNALASVFTVDVEAAQGVALATLASRVDEALTAALTEPFDDAAVNRARARFETRHLLAVEGVLARAEAFAAAAAKADAGSIVDVSVSTFIGAFARGPAPSDPDHLAFGALVTALGGLRSGGLATAMRSMGNGRWTSASLWVERDASYGSIDANVDPAHAVAVASALETALADAREGRLAPEIVEATKAVLLRHWRDALSGPDAVSFDVASTYARGGTWQDVATRGERIRALTSRDLARVAKTYFSDSASSFVVVTADPTVVVALDRIGIGPAESRAWDGGRP